MCLADKERTDRKGSMVFAEEGFEVMERYLLNFAEVME
jgi:hypothetical protein